MPVLRSGSSRGCAGCSTSTRSSSRSLAAFCWSCRGGHRQGHAGGHDLCRLGVSPVRGERPVPPCHLDHAGPPAHAPAGPFDDLPAHRRHLHPGRPAGPGRHAGHGRAGRGLGRGGGRDRARARLDQRAQMARRSGLPGPWLGGGGGHAAAVRPAGGRRAADRRRGLAYSAGAAVYALRRPDPVPAVFGYHEVFHLLVIAGVAAHFLAISLFALPTG